MGHIGHKKISGHTKFESEQQCHKDQINHIPLALHLSSRATVKFVQHSSLEAEREGVAIRVVLWQHKTLRIQPPCDESHHHHTCSRIWHRVARWPHPGPWTLNKASHTPINQRGHFTAVSRLYEMRGSVEMRACGSLDPLIRYTLYHKS